MFIKPIFDNMLDFDIRDTYALDDGPRGSSKEVFTVLLPFQVAHDVFDCHCLT